MPTAARGSRSKVKTVAPAVPLAIALLHSAVVSAPSSKGSETVGSDVVPVVCGESIEDYQACHSAYPTGCSPSGKYDAYLNEFKNYTTFKDPGVQTWFTSLDQLQTLESKLPDGLGKSNHGDYLTQLSSLGEGKIHGVVGYLYSAKPEQMESSNCELPDDADHENVDFHIYVGFDAQIAARLKNGESIPGKQTNPISVIVEMTPQYRGEFHPEWTIDAVKQHIGEEVRVEGQLMVDNEHYVQGQDCGISNPPGNCFRATVWELHPITDFKVCSSGTCTASSEEGWQDIGGSTAGKSPARGAEPSK